MIDSMDGAEEPTSSGWRSSGLRPQRGRMTGFLVAILGGGCPSHSRLLSTALQHHFPVDWTWTWMWVGEVEEEVVERMARRRRRCDDMSLLLSNAGRWIEEERLPSWALQNGPGSRSLWRAQAQRRRPLRVKAAPSARPAPRAPVKLTRPPSASLTLRPSAPTPPSTQSRTRSGGFDVPPASSQASLKRVFHASPGAAHVWARWKLPHSALYVQ